MLSVLRFCKVSCSTAPALQLSQKLGYNQHVPSTNCGLYLQKSSLSNSKRLSLLYACEVVVPTDIAMVVGILARGSRESEPVPTLHFQ